VGLKCSGESEESEECSTTTTSTTTTTTAAPVTTATTSTAHHFDFCGNDDEGNRFHGTCKGGRIHITKVVYDCHDGSHDRMPRPDEWQKYRQSVRVKSNVSSHLQEAYSAKSIVHQM